MGEISIRDETAAPVSPFPEEKDPTMRWALLILAASTLAVTSPVSPHSASKLATPCQSDKTCIDGPGSIHGELKCRCLAPNRGLKVCQPATVTSSPPDRPSLSCSSYLPTGAEPLRLPPPVVELGATVLDLQAHRNSPQSTGGPVSLSAESSTEPTAAIYKWAAEKAESADKTVMQHDSFYTKYSSICAANSIQGATKKCRGVSVLGTPGVSNAAMKAARRTVKHLLLHAARNPTAVMDKMAAANSRVVISGSRSGNPKNAWKHNPEVTHSFTTGLGGGAPWFPTTGIQQDDAGKQDDLCLGKHAGKAVQNVLVEEFFHSMQYTALTPRQVCLYHKAYLSAVGHGLYKPDRGIPKEGGGEPVPTVQADEYFAMALHAWMGVDTRPEYMVSQGNTAKSTGRMQLKTRDPAAFCILAGLFRADDTWSPCLQSQPWVTNPNKPVPHDSHVCAAAIQNLEQKHGICPNESVAWPATP